MAALSYLKREDINFLTNLISDITNELCECDCCKKEQGCSIFERVYIASNLLYKYVHSDDDPVSFRLNILDDESCIDWETISSRINNNSSQKHKFVDKSRKKILSRFYAYLYMIIGENGINASDDEHEDYEALTRSIFGRNAQNVIDNCLDECCNETVIE